MSASQGKTSRLPTASELAEMLKMGKTTEELAELFEVSTRTIKERLSDAGLIGRPRGPYRPKPEPPPVKFDYREEPWQEFAVCRRKDPALFDPTDAEDVAEAKAICKNECPVRDECLDYALRAEGTRGLSYRNGIWGGTVPAERHQMSLDAQREAS